MAMMGGGFGPQMMRSLRHDSSVTKEHLTPGTVRRIARYAKPFSRNIAAFLALVVVDSVIVIANPLLMKAIIDDGIIPRREGVVIALALVIAGLAIADAVLTLAQRWFSARIGEGLIYDLRTEVFDHVQRMPVAFFTRTQTGALVTRLNNDVIGAQRALTSTLSSVVSNVIMLVLVLVAMLVLSWQITLVAARAAADLHLPGQAGRDEAVRRSPASRCELNAEMSSMMTERFNVAGAMLVKLFGRPADEAADVRRQGGAGARHRCHRRHVRPVFLVALTLVAALATALVYGLGGVLAVDGGFELGTLVALAALLTRLYGPLTALSNVHVDVMTALVSFDRVFEVLDLTPMVAERPGRRAAFRGAGLASSSTTSGFRYPAVGGVAGLAGGGGPCPTPGPASEVLRGVTFTADPGQMVALVGPSGAGKTTITGLVSRLYDVTEGAVRIDGLDVRDVTLASLRDTVGVVTQDAHLFHDTIGANLRYARPEATDEEIWRGAAGGPDRATWSSGLPDGLDTVVGDRGTGCPAVRSSGWPSPGCCSRRPGWSCSTRRPRTSTPSPRPPCSRR